MTIPAYPVEGHPTPCPSTGSQPRLQEHQKTTISMFTENGIAPERIVLATECLENGVQTLLEEAGRMVVVADAYQELYGIDATALTHMYKKHGLDAMSVYVNGLVQISRQGLFQSNQDDGNEMTPADSTTEDEQVIIPPMGKKAKHLATTAGKRLRPETVRAKKTLPLSRPIDLTQSQPFGERPASTIVPVRTFVPSPGSTGQRRVVAHICLPRCPKYMKKQAFINHAALKHKINMPNEVHAITCCEEIYGDDSAYLDHQWMQHSVLLPSEGNQVVVTTPEDPDTPSSLSSNPASESGTAEC